MPDHCRSCDAVITWARMPPTEKNPEGANAPLCFALVYWPTFTDEIAAKREDLPEDVREHVSSRRTPVYEIDTRGGLHYAVKVGDFYIVKDEAAIADAGDINRRLVSHYATCPDNNAWSKGERKR